MVLQNWSDNIVLAELQDDPAFTDDLNSLYEKAKENRDLDVVLNFAGVNYVNSSNLAKLLRLRKLVTITNQRKMTLCLVNTHVWGVFLTTGLNKTFEFSDGVSVALAQTQLGRPDEEATDAAN
jgi:anti-anti-sigma factor